jgi:hypothetical protein
MRRSKPHSNLRTTVLASTEKREMKQPYAAEIEDYSGGKVVSPHTEALDHGETASGERLPEALMRPRPRKQPEHR